LEKRIDQAAWPYSWPNNGIYGWL